MDWRCLCLLQVLHAELEVVAKCNKRRHSRESLRSSRRGAEVRAPEATLVVSRVTDEANTMSDVWCLSNSESQVLQFAVDTYWEMENIFFLK